MNRNRLRFSLLLVCIIAAMTAPSCTAYSGVPNPFATQTPTPTQTLTPTSTATTAATRTPRPTATKTPTPTPLPTNFHLEKRWDGIRLVDEDGGYTLKLPYRWLAQDIDAERMATLLKQAAQTDRPLADLLRGTGMPPAGSFRLLAFDGERTHQRDGVVPSLAVMLIPGAGPSDPESFDRFVQLLVQVAQSSYADSKTTHELRFRTNPHGIRVTSMGFDLPEPVSGGGQVYVSKRISCIQTDTGLVMLSFTSPQAGASDMWHMADTTIDTIELLPE